MQIVKNFQIFIAITSVSCELNGQKVIQKLAAYRVKSGGLIDTQKNSLDEMGSDFRSNSLKTECNSSRCYLEDSTTDFQLERGKKIVEDTIEYFKKKVILNFQTNFNPFLSLAAYEQASHAAQTGWPSHIIDNKLLTDRIQKYLPMNKKLYSKCREHVSAFMTVPGTSDEDNLVKIFGKLVMKTGFSKREDALKLFKESRNTFGAAVVTDEKDKNRIFLTLIICPKIPFKVFLKDTEILEMYRKMIEEDKQNTKTIEKAGLKIEYVTEGIFKGTTFIEKQTKKLKGKKL